MPNLTNASFISNQAVNLYGRDYRPSMHVGMKTIADMGLVNRSVDVLSRFVHIRANF